MTDTDAGECEEDCSHECKRSRKGCMLKLISCSAP